MKKALITGITGQDGSYLAEFLISKGYQVHGIVRRASTFNFERIAHIMDKHDLRHPHAKVVGHYGDLVNAETINKLINQIKPDEIYNLGAQSHVKVSYEMPEYTTDVVGLGCQRILEAIRNSGLPIKFYQASSSEMFGTHPPPQNEKTPFEPCSPYAVAKAMGYYTTINYRRGYGIFACNGILFNHESPRRGLTFVTRKVTKGIADIKAGVEKKIYLGNLDSKRDWGYAPEFVEAMWLMLQQKKPDDYVIATGESHSVKEFVVEAFKVAGLDDWRKYVEIDPQYFRPVETAELRGDASKARKVLGWKPKVKFKELVKIMVEADLQTYGLKINPAGRRHKKAEV